MVSNTSPVLAGVPTQKHTTVEAYAPGYTRNRQGRSIAAITYGGRMPLGRIVVASPTFNMLSAEQQRRGCESAMLPDTTGDYTKDNLNGLLLTDASNAALLANMQVKGAYRVLGVSVEVKDCENCDCSECRDDVDPCPRGNPDRWMQFPVGRQGSIFDIATWGDYVGVRVVEDVVPGDLLDLVDAPLAGDTDCVVTLGSAAVRGNGVQALPDTWVVTGAAKAGEFAEVFLG